MFVLDGKLVQNASYQFPPGENFSEEVKTVCQFCFPEGDIPKASNSSNSSSSSSKGHRKHGQQTFSFVLTGTDGSKQYGYCRRYLDKGSAECVCVVSLVPSMALFSQVLDIIEEKRTLPHTAVFTVLKSVLALPFPEPGDSVVVRPLECREYTLTRPKSETLADYVSLAGMFRALSVDTVVELFGALLCEQRVLVGASDPEVLSQTMTALCAILYPFAWQHVFIPILPKSLVGYVTAPMPFFIGCLQSSLLAIRDMGMPLEEIYMLHADTGAILMRPSPSSITPLPPAVEGPLRNSLSAILSGTTSNTTTATATATGESAQDTGIARAFLRALQTLLTGYEAFFVATKPAERRSTKPLYFDTEGFLATRPEGDKPFLRAFFASQIWFMFMSDREAHAAKGDLRKVCPLLAPPAPIPMRTPADCGFGGGGQATCAACAHTVGPNDFCSAWEGRPYHTRCFACCECGALLEGLPKVVERDGAPACKACKRSQRSMTIAEVIDRKGGAGFGSSASSSAAGSIGAALSSSFGRMKNFIKDKSRKHSKRSGSASPAPSSSSSSSPALAPNSNSTGNGGGSGNGSGTNGTSLSSSSSPSSSSSSSAAAATTTKQPKVPVVANSNGGSGNGNGGGIVGNSPFLKNSSSFSSSSPPAAAGTSVTLSRSPVPSSSSFKQQQSSQSQKSQTQAIKPVTKASSQVQIKTQAKITTKRSLPTMSQNPARKTTHVPPSRPPPPPTKKQPAQTAGFRPSLSSSSSSSLSTGRHGTGNTTTTTTTTTKSMARPQTAYGRPFAGFK